MDRKLRNASSRKLNAKFALLLGVALLLAGSGCATKNGGTDSPSEDRQGSVLSPQVGGNGPVDPASESAASPSTQTASGLVYDQPYIWTQSPDSESSSDTDGSPGQIFFKYVFHRDGTCECYRRTRKSWLGPNDDSDNPEWTLLIGGAPFQIKSSSSSSSIRVDWSKCQPDTACAKTGANSDDAFFDIQSAGFRLVDASDQSVFILQRS